MIAERGGIQCPTMGAGVGSSTAIAVGDRQGKRGEDMRSRGRSVTAKPRSIRLTSAVILFMALTDGYVGRWPPAQIQPGWYGSKVNERWPSETTVTGSRRDGRWAEESVNLEHFLHGVCLMSA